MSSNIFRKFSTRFSKQKREETNGRSNGVEKPDMGRQRSSLMPQKKEKEKVEETIEHSAVRKDIETSFGKYAQLVHASRRPLPTQSGDGAYLDHTEPTGLMNDLMSLGFKDVGTMMQVMKTKATGELQDDKTYMMEHVIQLVASLPSLSKTRVDLTNVFLDELWNSLQHPPMSYMGDNFAYRSSDGSNNNIMYPHLGAANTPYARSVHPSTLSVGALPDPGLIFDSVMARQTFKPHPNKVSSVFFYWASLVIHDLFQTDHHDFNLSRTSSYLDLSILYGDTWEDQKNIRSFKDGKLKPDCFAEERLLGFPPGCGVLLIMLNRFHNHVVEQLAFVNENNRFAKPTNRLEGERAEKAWAKYDNDLFQTGRLVTCGLYINVTLYDYLRTIVNLNRSNTTWCLDPRVNIDKIFGKEGTPRGLGNQVSAEFNLAYRWHSCISEKDDKWTQDLYRELFGKNAEDVTMPELLHGLGKWEQSLDKDPSKRSFGGLKRDADGKFADNDLAKILTESVEDIAGAFGANNIPKCLKSITILGIQQARKWGLGSMNEFRKFFGLKTYDTFEDLNATGNVADQLRHLYEHPDYVEIYTGLVAEEAKKPMVPGVGIAPTFTISRAVLSDAVALVRGDRFYTVDYHPKNLTNWGYSEVQYDLNVNQGCVFYKLALRAFPNNFKPDSIYVHYPMTIPSENKKILKDLGREDQYSWDRPVPMAPRINVTSYVGAQSILERDQQFNVTWDQASTYPEGGEGGDLMPRGDARFHAKQKEIMNASFYQENWKQSTKDFYEDITLRLLHKHSCKLAGLNQVDITRDVGNMAHVHFVAQLFSLPLKSEDHPYGVYTEQELHMVLAVLFVASFLDLEPTKSFPLRAAAKGISQQLGKLIEANVRSVSNTEWVASVVDQFRQENSALKDYGVHMIRRLLEHSSSVHEVTWSLILPTAGAIVGSQAEIFTQVIDYYLSEEGKIHLAEINRVAKMDSAEADDRLLHYAMEGIRLNGTSGTYRQSASETTVDDGGRSVRIKSGDKVFVNFIHASREAEFFPEPTTVRIDRPLKSYLHYGVGLDVFLGGEVGRVALTTMLKVVGRLDNLRRAPGPAGQLKKIPAPGGSHVYLRSDHGSYFPFPTTMKVHWDGDLPPLKN